MSDDRFTVRLIEDDSGHGAHIQRMQAERREGGNLIHWPHCLESGTERIEKEGIDIILLNPGPPDNRDLYTLNKVGRLEELA